MKLPVWVVGIAGLAVASGGAAMAEDIHVVASFKPVHSLVAGVMAGVGEPALLVKGNASPHDYAMKPSDAAALEQADLVFWIGESFETFLMKPLESLPAGAGTIELGEVKGLKLLLPREGGMWDEHAHAEGEQAEGEEQGDDHDHDAFDGHLWLDPANAKLMVAAIVATLAERDPAHAAAYQANGESLRDKLDQLDSELAAELAPVKHVPFIVFHDAYQYLEVRYGLAAAGSVTVNPDQPPGAKRLQDIREAIATRGVRCVFREPNFEPAVVDMIVADTAARSAVLDPEGAALAEGPGLYFALMRDNAAALRECLASSS